MDTPGFSEHQYVAVRHDDTDHEHIHLAINKIHPDTFRIHSPAWDHQKLFTGARALERELGLIPLRSKTREREKIPERVIDCEPGTPELVEGVRARPVRSAGSPKAGLESLPRYRRRRATTAQEEVPAAATPPSCATRIGPRPKASFPAARAPPDDRNPSPQAEARHPAMGDSEDMAPWHLASFRRQPRCRARCSRDSPSEEPAAGTRRVQRGKGVVRFSPGEEIQFGDPKAKRSALQVDMTS